MQPGELLSGRGPLPGVVTSKRTSVLTYAVETTGQASLRLPRPRHGRKCGWRPSRGGRRADAMSHDGDTTATHRRINAAPKLAAAHQGTIPSTALDAGTGARHPPCVDPRP